MSGVYKRKLGAAPGLAKMLRFVAAVLVLVTHLHASPHMCHCDNGAVGFQCPNPIQLNCPPPPQCPPQLPCHTFPTLPPLGATHSLSQFTLPTIAPAAGSAFPSATTQLPLPVIPPVNGQESLLPIANQGFLGGVQQPGYVQQTVPAVSVPPPQFAQSAPQATAPPVPTVYVDATTKATTLPSEQYVEAENPEEAEQPQQQVAVAASQNSNGEKYSVFENEPNNGFRQPVRRALASNTQETLSEKCNDERLKKIIEQNVDSNPSSSKRKIQKAASDEIGGLFDVICSSHDFSYLANTQLFCEAGNDDVTCFAFLHSLIQ